MVSKRLLKQLILFSVESIFSLTPFLLLAIQLKFIWNMTVNFLLFGLFSRLFVFCLFVCLFVTGNEKNLTNIMSNASFICKHVVIVIK